MTALLKHSSFEISNITNDQSLTKELKINKLQKIYDEVTSDTQKILIIQSMSHLNLYMSLIANLSSLKYPDWTFSSTRLNDHSNLVRMAQKGQPYGLQPIWFDLLASLDANYLATNKDALPLPENVLDSKLCHNCVLTDNGIYNVGTTVSQKTTNVKLLNKLKDFLYQDGPLFNLTIDYTTLDTLYETEVYQIGINLFELEPAIDNAINLATEFQKYANKILPVTSN